MVSGNKSKAVRNARSAVVSKKSTPWGLIAAATVVVLFAGAVFGYAYVRNQEQSDRIEALAPFTPTAENPDPARDIEGVVVETYQGGGHVAREQQVAYTQSPPFGGTHDQFWAACNGIVYAQEVRSENMVHSLEHGAIWITYDPDQLDDAGVEALANRVAGEPFMVMTPYPDLETPFSLQAWGHQLMLSDPNDVRIDQFIQGLRRNQYTVPEPNGTCNVQSAQQFDENNPPPFVPAPPVSAIDNTTVFPETGVAAAAPPPAN